MSVQVISTPPKKQCTCTTCRSTLEYSYSDMVHKVDYEGDSYAFIVCPVCNKNVYVQAKF